MGRRDSTVALALADVAKARAELGELAEAEQLFREALDNQRARSQGDHATVKTLVGLGEVLIRPCPSPATSACGKPAAKHLAIQRAPPPPGGDAGTATRDRRAFVGRPLTGA